MNLIIRNICNLNNIDLVDSEIRIISYRMTKLDNIYYKKEQFGGNINNLKIIKKNLNTCISPLFILKNTDKNIIEHFLKNILKGNYVGVSLICSKYKK